MPFDYKDSNIIKLRVDFTHFLSSTIYTKLDELTLQSHSNLLWINKILRHSLSPRYEDYFLVGLAQVRSSEIECLCRRFLLLWHIS